MRAVGFPRVTSWLSTCVGLGLIAWAASCLMPAAAGGEPARGSRPPTFAKDVAPILQNRCARCHRADHVGPFPLQTYEQARKRAEDIAAVAGDGVMPPWKPARGIGPALKH